MMNKQSLTIYIVRHGQAEFNVKRMIGGTYEPNTLTVEGEKQAHTLANLFAEIKIDKIYSSDLSRAKKTAEILTAKHNLPVTTSELLRERYWGRLQGKTFEEARIGNEKMYEIEKNITGIDALKFKYVEDMESLDDAIMRIKQFIEDLIKAEKNKTVLLVSHFDLMIGYLVSLGYGTYQELMKAEFDHTGYYRLSSDGKNITIDEVIGLHVKKNL